MKKINLSIIIVSYNVKEKIMLCIKPLTRLRNSEIIIIDNNSKDNSYIYLYTQLKNIKIIKLLKNSTNNGFSKAVNQGIKISRGNKILLLNPDTIPNKKAIKQLQNFLDTEDDIGLVGGKMIKPISEKVHGTFVNMPNFLTGIFEFTNLKKIFKYNMFSNKFYYKNEVVNKPKLVYGLSGGFLMFKKELIKKIGMLDENFFMYLEDVDFGIRSRLAGYKNYYLPYAKIIHDSGSSSNNKYKINVDAWRKSKKYFFKKYLNHREYLFLSLIFYVDDFINDLKHKLLKENLS